MNQNIVARYQDGQILKGTTADFFPNRDEFHVVPVGGGEVTTVAIADLKGVFFVKTFDGNPEYRDRQDVEQVGLGRKIKVAFKDGETLVGYTSGYSPGRKAFFVFPADPDSNNERTFVVTASTLNVAFI